VRAATLLLTSLLLAGFAHAQMPPLQDYRECTRTWQPQTALTLALDGLWCYSYQTHTGVLRVPGLWHSEQADGHPLPGVAVVTYRLRVRHDIIEQPVSIRLPRPYDQYRVLVNGQAVLHDGTVPYISERQPHYWQFRTSGETTDILIEVSNERFVSGGLREAPAIGLSSAVNDARLQRLALEAVQSGLLLLMAFILFAQYAAMRQHSNAGSFYALTCLGVAIFAGLGGEQWLSLVLTPWDIHPDLNWRWAMIAVSVLGLSEFTHRQYPRDSLPYPLYAWRIITCVFLLACLTLAPRALAWTFWGLEILALVMAAYLVGVVALAALRQRENALITATLYVLLFMATAHDILVDFTGIYSGNFGPTAMVLCLIGQGLVLSRQNARAHMNSLALVERLERAEKVKDDFLANTSHELRTPLQTIIGLASGERSENRRLIADTARRLALLVDDLMDLTRLRHQEIRLEKTSIPVKTELQTLQQLFLPLVAHRSLSIDIDAPEPTLCVEADPKRLRQVLYNLLGNAVKFTAQGNITLYASRSNGKVSLGVRDSGPGMTPDQQFKALARYEQLGRNREGVGLGLPISQAILQAHGSALEIRSSNAGTNISFLLEEGSGQAVTGHMPALSQISTSSSSPLEHPEPQALQAADNADYILIIDDDGAVLEALAHMLSPLATPVVIESRIESALARIGQHPPALLILDLMMPQISGFELLQTLRLQYDQRQLPIIVLTARHGQHDLRRALTLGANDYAVKPCEPLELLERARGQLRLRRGETSLTPITKLSVEQLNSGRPIALVSAGEDLLDGNTSGRALFSDNPRSAELKLPLGDGYLLLWPLPALPEEPRTLLVTAIQEAYARWQELGGNRVSLAEKSRQWRVQIDGSTARARTFDRYFSLATLPKRPHIDRVINTVRFVINQLPDNSQHTLNEYLDKLEQARQENRQTFYK